MRDGLGLRWRIILFVAGLALLLLVPLTSITFYVVVGEHLPEGGLPLYPFLIAGGVGVLGLIPILYLLLDRLVLAPLRRLAEHATALTAGDVGSSKELDRQDEFGLVAQRLADVVRRLHAKVAHLEDVVAERTDALERRNAQLEAMAAVSQEAARERTGFASTPVNALLETAVDAVAENFGFYHVGIYILDDSQEWAVLRAASSDGGRRLLSRGHRVRVGQTSIVGFVAAQGVPRMAFDVEEEEAVLDEAPGRYHFAFEAPGSDLPLTRSEAALPMIFEGRVVGVVDVQSDQARAFSDDDVRMLQLMADQLTVALNNARTLERMEAALAELQQLQVDYSRRGWARVTKRVRPLAYEYDQVDTIPVAPLPVPDEVASGAEDRGVVVDGGMPVVMEPLRIGDQILGYLGLSDSKRVWTEEELALVRSIGEQVALALDNARLFEDTQRNERQQYLISRVLQAGTDPELDAEEVLQEIARILAQGLDMAVVIFTFPYPDAPVVHSHAVVSPEGELISLIDEDLTLTQEHFVFFQGLMEPEFGPLAPLLGHAVEQAEAPSSRADAGSPGAGLEGYDLQRVLYVPIVSAGVRNGFIGLIQPADAMGDRDTPPPVDPHTRELAQSLAGQISVVLENLNLSEQTQRTLSETEALYHGSAALSEVDSYQGVLDVLLAHTVLGRKVHRTTLQLFDRPWTDGERPGHADVVAHRSADPEVQLPRRQDLPGVDAQDLPLTPDGAEELQPLFIEDLARYRQRASDMPEQQSILSLVHPADGTQSLVVLPLVVGGQWIGYLHADYQHTQTFTETDRRRLISLAQQASIAVLNIRQLRATEARARREQLIRHIAGRIQEAGDVQGVLQTAVRELGQAFGTSRSRIQFRPPEDSEDTDG
ncbi:MAG: GAF domain-containing protein [Anaerolineae bacterium]